MLELYRHIMKNGGRVHITFVSRPNVEEYQFKGAIKWLKEDLANKGKIDKTSLFYAGVSHFTYVMQTKTECNYFITRYVFTIGRPEDGEPSDEELRQADNDLYEYMKEPITYPKKAWPYILECFDRVKTAVDSAAMIRPSDPDWGKFILEASRYAFVIYGITNYGDIDEWKEKVKEQEAFMKEFHKE